MIIHLLVLTLLVTEIHLSPTRANVANCQACPSLDPDKINVHLIPHSHDDLGWQKTIDQYYYGSHNDIRNAGVQYIISSAVEALKLRPDRRFVQVETAFFWKWWNNQRESVKEDVVKLVNDGQLEITSGAWSMNDEAGTNYQSIIDQFTYGLRIINETVGNCGTPTIGWQIDPFGHSREQASIFAQMGYDAVFFARISNDDRNQRERQKTMEVVWKGSANLDHTHIFANVLPQFYYFPWGYCYDITCDSQTLNDDENSPEYNIPRQVNYFANSITSFPSLYQTRNLILPMGGDFMYQSAEKNFANMDKLIKGFKEHPTLNLVYSTPSCYVQAVNAEAMTKNINFTEKTDDFFPYGSDVHTYWAGYFTSRPNAKRFARIASNLLQAAKQLASFAKVNGKDIQVTALQQAVGILQHHDAITGTATQDVANDYMRLLSKAVAKAETSLGAVVTDLLRKDDAASVDLTLETCLLANVSICDVTKNKRFVVAVYNPLERPINHLLRLAVPEGTYEIVGEDIVPDLFDSISDFKYVEAYLGVPNPKELVFPIKDLAGFGIRLYHIERTGSQPAETKIPKFRFGTEETAFEIDEASGLLKSVTMNGQTVEMTQQFLYYEGHSGSNNFEADRASGAYVFRPQRNEATPFDSKVVVTSTSGNFVDEVHQKVNDWISQIIRVYKNPQESYIEFDWLVGPIEADSGIGHEVITRFTVRDLNNSEVFYTDSNGREMIKRQLNKRYDYEYSPLDEPIASNYYPVTSKIVIRDETKKLEVAVLNDRAQGGSSLRNGEIELMVHRRLLKDDDQGVNEALNDTEFGQGVVARGRHYLIVGPTGTGSGKSVAVQERELALRQLLAPVVLLGDVSSNGLTLQKLKDTFNFNFESLKATLPDNVHILTLEPWQEDSHLLRLEHIVEKDEDENLSKSVTVSLKGLFTLFDITFIRETTLGANQFLEDFEVKEKYVWNLKNGKKVVNKKSTPSIKADSLEIALNPMQIRTFVIKVSKTKF